MTNIGVNAIGNFLGNFTATKAVERPEGTEGSFDETLNGLKTEKANGISQPDKAEVNKAPDDFEAKTKHFDSKKPKEIAPEAEEPTDEQIAAMAEEVISQIKQVITEQFNVSEEELSDAMTSLGITDENLLDVNVVKNLVMKLSGIEEPAELLTNQDFTDKLKNLLELVEAGKEKIGTEVNVELKPDDMAMTLEQKDTETEATTEATTEVEVENQPEVSEEEVVVKDSDNEEAQVDDVEDEKKLNTKISEETANVSTENEQQSKESSSDGLLKQDDAGKEQPKSENLMDRNVIQPQDFAARLTEDLSARVGEKQATEIVRQVTEQVQVSTKQGMTTMELQLYPAHLGRVVVQLVSKEGVVTAQITAETEAAKNALEGQLTLLKENLNNQGVKIENVEVTIASHAFEQNMQGESNGEQSSSKGNRGKRAAKLLNEDFGIEVTEEPSMMDFRGNTVSYSA